MTDAPLCPILSLATLAQPKPMIAAPLGSPQPKAPSATACVGSKCAWWVPETDEKGKIVSGHCAITALPVVSSQVAQTNNALAQAIMAVIAKGTPTT